MAAAAAAAAGSCPFAARLLQTLLAPLSASGGAVGLCIIHPSLRFRGLSPGLGAQIQALGLLFILFGGLNSVLLPEGRRGLWVAGMATTIDHAVVALCIGADSAGVARCCLAVSHPGHCMERPRGIGIMGGRGVCGRPATYPACQVLRASW